MKSSKTPFSAPWPIVRKATSRAPQRTVSENWGRQGGFYGDDDVTTRGYESVMLYVRKGLGIPEIILPVVKFAFQVQQDLGAKWTLVPVSHGWGNELKHLGTDFPMRYLNESFRSNKIADAIGQMAENQIDPGPVVIRKLFPPTGLRSLYGGKIKVSRDDLLVFVDIEGDLKFDFRQRFRLGTSMQRQMVFVEVSPSLDRASWDFASKRIEFTEPEILSEKPD